MVFHIIPHHLSTIQIFFKRAFDLLFSSIGLIVAAIPMAFIALAIKIFDPGPVFYKQVRLTKDCLLYTSSPGRLPSWVRIIGVKALKSHQRSSSSLLRFISNRVV